MFIVNKRLLQGINCIRLGNVSFLVCMKVSYDSICAMTDQQAFDMLVEHGLAISPVKCKGCGSSLKHEDFASRGFQWRCTNTVCRRIVLPTKQVSLAGGQMIMVEGCTCECL